MRVAILGATGSIGSQALAVIKLFPDQFQPVMLAAHSNWSSLLKIYHEYPNVDLWLATKHARQEILQQLPTNFHRQRLLDSDIKVLEDYLSTQKIDIVISAFPGISGVWPTIWSIQKNRSILLANKDSLVVAGQWIMAEVQKQQATLLPVDSEHSGLLQCLSALADIRGRIAQPDSIKELGITASGGPFWQMQEHQLQNVQPAQACQHPTWQMGHKNSIDSATLANKALEIIEAHWLFNCPAQKIKVMIDRQSMLHAWVGFCDGNYVFHAAPADMRLAIAYALGYPERLKLPELHHAKDFELGQLLPLQSCLPQKWMMLDLGYQVILAGQTAAAVFATANHWAVHAFLNGVCSFLEIRSVVEWALVHLEQPKNCQLTDLSGLLQHWQQQLSHKLGLPFFK